MAAARAPRARRVVAVTKRVDIEKRWAELKAVLEAAHAAGVGAGAEEYALRALDASIFDAKQLVAGAPQPEPLVANAGDGSLIRDDPAALGGGNRKRRRAAEKPDDAPPPQTLLAAAAPGKAKKPKAIWDQLLATPGAPEGAGRA
jgi:hypothetical protein